MSGPTANRLEPAFWWVVPARALGVGVGLTLTALLLLVGEVSPVLLVVLFVPALVALVAILVSLLAPVAVYRERRTLDPDGEWYPSRWYYLLAIPSGLLPFVLSVVYTHRRLRYDPDPRPTAEEGVPQQSPTVVSVVRRSAVRTVRYPALVAVFALLVLSNGFLRRADLPTAVLVGHAALYALSFSLPLVYAAAERGSGTRTPRLAIAVGVVATRSLHLLVLGVVYVVVTGVGLVLFVLPGLYVGSRLLFAFPECVLNGRGVRGSLAAAWRTSRGAVGRILAVLVAATAAVVCLLLVATVSVSVLESLGSPPDASLTLVACLFAGVSFPLLSFTIAQLHLERQPSDGHVTPAVEPPGNTRVR